jgi:hypothetical protein
VHVILLQPASLINFLSHFQQDLQQNESFLHKPRNWFVREHETASEMWIKSQQNSAWRFKSYGTRCCVAGWETPSLLSSAVLSSCLMRPQKCGLYNSSKTTWYLSSDTAYVPEDLNLRQDCCRNLRSHRKRLLTKRHSRSRSLQNHRNAKTVLLIQPFVCPALTSPRHLSSCSQWMSASLLP